VNDLIKRIGMPKWGLSMTEGRLNEWLVEEGSEISEGDEVAEVETDKITGAVEAPVSGLLRRRVAGVNEVVPVGGLIAVVAPTDVGDEEIDAYIAEFQATFVPGDLAETATGPVAETVPSGAGLLHIVIDGEGDETVLLLHGFGGDAENWRFNMDGLASGRQVIALDFPGHGVSTKDVGDGSADRLVDAARAVLDHKGVQTAHLVGHSVGGLVAAELALRSRDRVKSLSFIASAGFGTAINATYLDGFVTAQSRRELKPAIELLFADRSLVTRQLLDEILRYKRIDGVSEALEALQVGIFDGNAQRRVVTGELEALDLPTLVVWGAEDKVLPADQASTAPPGARVEILEGIGHSPHVEAATVVTALLDEFFREVETTA
jgi:pyruvate dehydrogenase E2 component (dihydrolipoamide acetyltransferase)